MRSKKSDYNLACLFHIHRVFWHVHCAGSQVVSERWLLVERHLQLSRVGPGNLVEAGEACVHERRRVGDAHALKLLRDVLGVVPDGAVEALRQYDRVLDSLVQVAIVPRGPEQFSETPGQPLADLHDSDGLALQAAVGDVEAAEMRLRKDRHLGLAVLDFAVDGKPVASRLNKICRKVKENFVSLYSSSIISSIIIVMQN